MDNTEQLIISFCSGYGGIERGLELAGLKHRVVAYVEIEAFAITNLVAKMEQGHLVPAPVWTDLKTFPVEKFRGRVHGIIGGYPCQPFSVAGQRKGADDPRHLWPYIREAIRVIQPEWCFFENVEGHLSLGFREVKQDLESLRYRVEAGLFSAEEVGAPHRRKRLFILADSISSGKRNAQEQDQMGQRELLSGELDNRNEIRGNTSSRGGKSEELDDSRCQRQTISQEQTAGIEQSGQKLGDASNIRQCGLSEESRETSTDAEREECWVHESEGTSALSGYGSQQEELADCNCIDAQRKRADNPEERRKDEDGSTGLCHRTRWPSRPGEPQHEWEEPRTVESGVGSTVDGIDTRVDQLRLLGNGVVPQTAAKAWVTLNERKGNER